MWGEIFWGGGRWLYQVDPYHGRYICNSYMFFIHSHCLILLDSSHFECLYLKLICIESLSLVYFIMLSQLHRLGLFIVDGRIIINDKLEIRWRRLLWRILRYNESVIALREWGNAWKYLVRLVAIQTGKFYIILPVELIDQSEMSVIDFKISKDCS